MHGVPSGQGGDNNDTEDSAKKTFQQVLRSKGFVEPLTLMPKHYIGVLLVAYLKCNALDYGGL
jgi:hypothetical protein